MARMIPKYRLEIQRMMYTFGEATNPLPDTTDVVENIIRDQLTEIIHRATDIAARRSSRFIYPLDILFTVRHNKEKISRVQRFFRWKEMRRTDGEGPDIAPENEHLTEEEIIGIQDSQTIAHPETGSGLVLPGSTYTFHNQTVVKAGADFVASSAAYRQRLEDADRRTFDMTEAEYLNWVECRNASFIKGRKGRFREWLGMEHTTHLALHEDTLEVLGLLAIDAIENLTREALKVRQNSQAQAVTKARNSSPKERPRDQTSPFDLHDKESVGSAPLQVRHIREAFQRLQANPRQKVANLLGNRRAEDQLPRVLI